jgi:hypothetical protein
MIMPLSLTYTNEIMYNTKANIPIKVCWLFDKTDVSLCEKTKIVTEE